MSTSHVEEPNNHRPDQQGDSLNKPQAEKPNTPQETKSSTPKPVETQQLEGAQDQKEGKVEKPNDLSNSKNLQSEKKPNEEENLQKQKGNVSGDAPIQKSPDAQKQTDTQTKQETQHKEENKPIQDNESPKKEAKSQKDDNKEKNPSVKKRIDNAENHPSPKNSQISEKNEKTEAQDSQEEQPNTMRTTESLTTSQTQAKETKASELQGSDLKPEKKTQEVVSPKNKTTSKPAKKNEEKEGENHQEKVQESGAAQKSTEHIPKENNQTASKEEGNKELKKSVIQEENEHSAGVNNQEAKKVQKEDVEVEKPEKPKKKKEKNSSQELSEEKEELTKSAVQEENKHSADIPKQEAKKGKKEEGEVEKAEKPKKKKEKNSPQELSEDNEKGQDNPFGAIVSLISPTGFSTAESSTKVAAHLVEALKQSPAKTKNVDIDPDDMEKVSGFEEEQDDENDERHKTHESEPLKSTNQKSDKSLTSKARNDRKSDKRKSNFEVDTTGETFITSKKGLQSSSPKKSPLSLKAQVELANAKVKKRNTVEEQVRVHKMQEMKRWKKDLQGKLESITEQMTELAQEAEQAASLSPREADGSKKKLTKAEIAEKQQKAADLARRMQMERKEMERRKEKRRDVRQALALKDIDLYHQRQLDNLELINEGGSARARFEKDIMKLGDKTKQEKIFAALEEKKHDIKAKREFSKGVIESEHFDTSDRSQSIDRADRRLEPVNKPTKKVYKSPVLKKVLEQDAEKKRVEYEQKERRRLLMGRKAGYGKEIRDSFFPYLHPLKQAESYVPIMDVLYSPNRPLHVDLLSPIKLPAKDQVRLPTIDKKESPNKSSKKSVADIEDIIRSKKSKAKQYQREMDKEEYEEFVRHEEQDFMSPTGEDLNNYHKKGGALSQSKSAVTVAPRNKSLPPAHRKQTVPEVEVDDYGYEVRNEGNGGNSKKNKVNVQKREEIEEEDNEWEKELEADQEILKDKISGMLGEIKKMEMQIKRKEERMLKEIEKKGVAKAQG